MPRRRVGGCVERGRADQSTAARGASHDGAGAASTRRHPRRDRGEHRAGVAPRAGSGEPGEGAGVPQPCDHDRGDDRRIDGRCGAPGEGGGGYGSPGEPPGRTAAAALSRGATGDRRGRAERRSSSVDRDPARSGPAEGRSGADHRGRATARRTRRGAVARRRAQAGRARRGLARSRRCGSARRRGSFTALADDVRARRVAAPDAADRCRLRRAGESGDPGLRHCDVPGQGARARSRGARCRSTHGRDAPGRCVRRDLRTRERMRQRRSPRVRSDGRRAGGARRPDRRQRVRDGRRPR